MVFFDPIGTGWSNASFLAELATHGVRMGEVSGEIRAVTHLDVSRADIDAAVTAIATISRTPCPASGSTDAASKSSGY